MNECMCQEKKEEKLPALKVASVHRFKDSKSEEEEWSQQPEKKHRKHKHQQNKNK